MALRTLLLLGELSTSSLLLMINPIFYGFTSLNLRMWCLANSRSSTPLLKLNATKKSSVFVLMGETIIMVMFSNLFSSLMASLEQNGMVEHKNRAIMEIVYCMFHSQTMK
jgi:hypothetical protein